MGITSLINSNNKTYAYLPSVSYSNYYSSSDLSRIEEDEFDGVYMFDSSVISSISRGAIYDEWLEEDDTDYFTLGYGDWLYNLVMQPSIYYEGLSLFDNDESDALSYWRSHKINYSFNFDVYFCIEGINTSSLPRGDKYLNFSFCIDQNGNDSVFNSVSLQTYFSDIISSSSMNYDSYDIGYLSVHCTPYNEFYYYSDFFDGVDDDDITSCEITSSYEFGIWSRYDGNYYSFYDLKQMGAITDIYCCICNLSITKFYNPNRAQYIDGYNSAESSGGGSYSTGYQIGFTAGYDKGYDDGESAGYDTGYDEGVSHADTHVNTSSASYIKGYDDGEDSGYTTGVEEGYTNGYSAGNTAGYNSGFADGAVHADQNVNTNSASYTAGYNAGETYGEAFADGRVNIESESYKKGYYDGDLAGYTTGVADGIETADNRLNENSVSYKDGVKYGQQTNFNALVLSIANTPFMAFKTIWNFDILGFNLAGFIFGLLSILMVIYLVKKFLK